MTEESLRILIVDDEVQSGEMMKRSLRRFGTVDLVDDAETAWEKAQGQKYDVVISDQRMPGTTGVELLSRVARRSPSSGRILVTAYTDLTAAIDAINHGHVHAYLPKPCLPDKLRDTVAEILRRTDRERETERLVEELRERNRRLADAVKAARLASDRLRSR